MSCIKTPKNLSDLLSEINDFSNQYETKKMLQTASTLTNKKQ